MTTEPTSEQIDAGAKALREYDMAGRITQPWHVLPNSPKRKWRDKSAVVLKAALAASEKAKAP